MASNPQVAGKTFPAVCRASGSMVTGNMIPDMIMDGIKISCVAMPTLDELLLYRPNTMPTLRLTTMSSSKSKKYAVRSAGTFASKKAGAVKKMTRLMANICTRLDKKLPAARVQRGMLPT